MDFGAADDDSVAGVHPLARTPPSADLVNPATIPIAIETGDVEIIPSDSEDLEGEETDASESGAVLGSVPERFKPNHPVWLLVDFAQATSSRHCPPQRCPGQRRVDKTHDGPALIPCTERWSDSLCLHCAVRNWCEKMVSPPQDPWLGTVREIRQGDAMKARVRLDVVENNLPDPMEEPVSVGQRVLLSKPYVSATPLPPV